MKIRIIVPVIDYNDYSAEKEYIDTVKQSDTEIVPECIKYGFNTVESELMGIVNGAQVIIKGIGDLKEGKDFDAYVVDCFDDPGVAGLREIIKRPVIGVHEAALKKAISYGRRIGIITTDEAGIQNEWRKARIHGFDKYIDSIEPADIEVESLMESPESVKDNLVKAIEKMVRDGIGTVVLGCTEMFSIAKSVTEFFEEKGETVNIIEPLANAIITAEEMVESGHSTYVPTCISMDLINSDRFLWEQNE